MMSLPRLQYRQMVNIQPPIAFHNPKTNKVELHQNGILMNSINGNEKKIVDIYYSTVCEGDVSYTEEKIFYPIRIERGYSNKPKQVNYIKTNVPTLQQKKVGLSNIKTIMWGNKRFAKIDGEHYHVDKKSNGIQNEYQILMPVKNKIITGYLNEPKGKNKTRIFNEILTYSVVRPFWQKSDCDFYKRQRFGYDSLPQFKTHYSRFYIPGYKFKEEELDGFEVICSKSDINEIELDSNHIASQCAEFVLGN